MNGKAGSPVGNQDTTAQSIAVDDPKVVASDRLASHAAERNRSMIRCIPRGICSWNFVLDGAGHQGILELGRSDDVIATVRPDHAFTRRASIEILTKQWDLPTVYFSFWLVALMWRRAAQSNNG